MFDHEAAHSKEEFDREFEKALDMIYSIGLKLYSGNEDDASDFTQSFYPFALKQSKKFSGASAFSTWLYRVAWNFGLTDLRKKKRLKTDDISDFEIAAPESAAIFEETEIESLRHHIASLPDGYRIPIILLFFENMSYAEIAKLTATKEGTLKANVHRAKKILRDKILEGAKS